MIDLLIWLVVGGVIGWLASALMYSDGGQGVLVNVVVGIVGAALGGGFISPLMGVGEIDAELFNVGASLVSLVGAIVLLAVVNVFVQRPVR